jgi:predicted membrane-bound spermidine synthase/Na+-translocating ferredoxin:NAD+ oxidoreductase RnfG subunit
MKFVRYLFIFSFGLFTIAAQTLVFREFLTTFEGNDISVGIFFACWFLWVGLGAVLVYKLHSLAKAFVNHIELLFLFFLPALAIQFFFIINARQILSIEHFTLLSIRTVFFLSLIANAPVSLLTGMLFPTACRWIQQLDSFPVSRVYILEAAGSFVGGLAATILLALSINSITITLLLFLLVSLVSALVFLSKNIYDLKKSFLTRFLNFSARTFIIAIPLLMLLAMFGSFDKSINRNIQAVKWSRLLPPDSFQGAFQTPQAEYLYGSYRNQWLIARDGSVIEAVPEQSNSAVTASIVLSQNPNAKKILVIGPGISICNQFLKLPQTESVCWAYCDSEYIKKIMQILPADYKISDQRFSPLSADIRSFLAANEKSFDIVVVNLPDATSSVLNRYFTVQFYQLIKNSLRQDGLVSVRVSGGENIMGTELVNLGASVRNTLQTVFSHFTLTAGEQSFFLASDSSSLSDKPLILKDQFKNIPGSGKILSADALLSIYIPDRIEKAQADYDNALLPDSLLLNRDNRPLTHLYSLLLAAKQSDIPVTVFIKSLALAGLPVFLAPVFLIILMRFLFLIRSKFASTKYTVSSSSYDSSFLAFTAGLSGIAVVIILMYLYQTRFGSLYLHIGVISSIFMLALAAGAALYKFILEKFTRLKPQVLLIPVIFLYILLLSALEQDTFFNSQNLPPIYLHLIFAFLFFLSGLFTGCLFPIAATQLSIAGFETGNAASKLELADHLGACLGSLLTGLLLVPILGTKLSIIFLMIIIAANLPPAILEIISPKKITAQVIAVSFRKKSGYALFAIAVSVVLWSNLLTPADNPAQAPLLQTAAQKLAPNLQIQSHSFTQNDKTAYYCSVLDSDKKISGYIFCSDDFAPEVRGFGGKINLAVFTDSTGSLIDYLTIQSNETPEYLDLIKQAPFKGKNLLSPKPFEGIAAVTGATISFNAVSLALQSSTTGFFSQVIGSNNQIFTKNLLTIFLPDKIGIYLTIAFCLTLLLTFFGGYKTRLLFLALNLTVGGLWLNTQLSTSQITNLLSLRLPAAAFTGVFLITVFVPLLTLIFGNLYCGYLCPFGALQELVSDLLPYKFTLRPSTLQKAFFTKYILLFLIIITFFLTGKSSALAADPLIKFFSGLIDSVLIYTVVFALFGSLFFPRFWCIYLCPTGAFLSLLNRISLLKRLLPPKKFALCDFAISAKEPADCIMCDRCRFNKTQPLQSSLAEPKQVRRPVTAFFVFAVAAFAVFISAATLNNFSVALPKSPPQSAALSQSTLSTTALSTTAPSATTPSPTGHSENADIQRIKSMIDSKKLSDKEAQFYKKVQ